MKKICIICQNVYEDENIKCCPNCKNIPKWMPTLCDYDEYEVIANKAQEPDQPSNLPKCPTCGSTNIRHISSTERGVNAVMFGFFGNKRKCQFECLNPNCRYRW